ncbi:MAG TPA: integration host factor subunit alpha [Syntrophales bacterium]|nr:integration host factor subunit alpha [Syntrophales bacterium]
MALTKFDLVEMIYGALDLPKNECIKLVESFFDIIKDELVQGNDVMISGFGKWSVKNKNSRYGRNPQTGERITIDARRVVTFKGAENLKTDINSGS